MWKEEKNVGNRAGDQITNYLLLAKLFIAEDFTQWQQL